MAGPPILEQVESEISTATLAGHPELRALTQFTAEWSGVLVAHYPNLHRFATKSDDGSWLWIDDRLVIDNGGVHGPQNVTAEVFLERGVHTFRVRYIEAGGGSLLTLGSGRVGAGLSIRNRSSLTTSATVNCVRANYGRWALSHSRI